MRKATSSAHWERPGGGDKIRAAGILGLSLSTLYRKIEKLEIKD
jgi:DNA-binding NtrC family response regulator